MRTRLGLPVIAMLRVYGVVAADVSRLVPNLPPGRLPSPKLCARPGGEGIDGPVGASLSRSARRSSCAQRELVSWFPSRPRHCIPSRPPPLPRPFPRRATPAYRSGRDQFADVCGCSAVGASSELQEDNFTSVVLASVLVFRFPSHVDITTMADSAAGTAPSQIDPAVLIRLVEAQFDIPKTFGAYLICTCLGCIMLGLTIHQTYRYFRFYPNDILSLKLLVILVLVLDIAHSISSMHICYFYLVSNYFHPQRLWNSVWSFRMIILEMGLLIIVAHCFYARRLYLLANKNVIPAIMIGLLLGAELALCITATVDSYRSVSFHNFEHYSWVMWGILSVAVVVDIFATTALTYYLRKSRTGFVKTDSIVDILMVYTINTGLSTSITTIASLICAILMPKNLVYSAILVVGTKMYANSLLAVLNSRRGILDKGMSPGYDTGSFGLQVIDARHGLEETRVRADRHELRAIRFKSPIFARPDSERADSERGLNLKVASASFADMSRMHTPPMATKSDE
ncbi:hypothetical protein C8Q79DRAFT_946776 [Trametes meyenii]|nr:hypothetical protein C8Q79DRAFT_946776 [Trametes meyenii]